MPSAARALGPLCHRPDSHRFRAHGRRRVLKHRNVGDVAVRGRCVPCAPEREECCPKAITPCAIWGYCTLPRVHANLPGHQSKTNQLLNSLDDADRALIQPHLSLKRLRRGEVLFEPGQDVDTTYFPVRGALGSLLIILEDGREVEAAGIGWEGALGGIVSGGSHPAYSRAL